MLRPLHRAGRAVPQDAGVLVTEREIAGYYDAAVAAGAPAKRAANWVHQRGAGAR